MKNTLLFTTVPTILDIKKIATMFFSIIFLLNLPFLLTAKEIINYDAIIYPCVEQWNNDCIAILSPQEIVTITDTILLSYQVIQASLIMSQARLVIQSELFNIITLSINDTFDVRLQAQNNDLTKIKDAVTAIEQAQEQIKFACNALKSFGPLIINIDPSTIQLFISNLKDVILVWSKSQHDTILEFEEVKQEFITTAHLFSNIKNIFDLIACTETTEHSQLLQGANSLTDMYQKIENTFARLTITRKVGVANLETILRLFFKYHYQVLYDYLQEHDMANITLTCTSQRKLPMPQEIFIIS